MNEELEQEPELTEMPLATLREEIRLLRQFMTTSAYADFRQDFQKEYDEAKDIVWDTIPETLGDDKKREQAIGAAKWLDYAKDWFQIQLNAYEQTLKEREPMQI